jgi:hypothetical protein
MIKVRISFIGTTLFRVLFHDSYLNVGPLVTTAWHVLGLRMEGLPLAMDGNSQYAYSFSYPTSLCSSQPIKYMLILSRDRSDYRWIWSHNRVYWTLNTLMPSVTVFISLLVTASNG